MKDLKDFHDNLDRMNAAQSKVNIQNDIDNFAIEFYYWMLLNNTEDNADKFCNYSDKDMLNKFKEQRR